MCFKPYCIHFFKLLKFDFHSLLMRSEAHRFGVTFVHANLCLHAFIKRSLGWEGGLGII